MYLNYKESEKQTLENLFGSLVRQLISKNPSTSQTAAVGKLMNELGGGASPLKLKEIVEVIRSEIQKFQRVYLVVDALDECDEITRHQLELQLKDLQSGRLSVMITSRYLGIPPVETVNCDVCEKTDIRIFYHCQVCDDGNFDLCQDCVDNGRSCKDKTHSLFEPYSAVEIDMVIPDQDIRRFVEFELEKKIGEVEKYPKPHSYIISAVAEKAKGNFLIAKLYMDSLERQQTGEQIEKLLRNPSGILDNYYEQIMRRITAQHEGSSALAIKALSWIVFSNRPLEFEELQQAMAIVPGADDINPNALCDIWSLISITAGLVTIDSEHTLRLVHESAQVYLGLQAKVWFPSVRIDIALAILSFMSFSTVSKPWPSYPNGQEFKERKKSCPLLFYTAEYWGEHVRQVIHKPVVQAATLRFLRHPSSLASCSQARLYVPTKRPSEHGRPGNSDGLRECARFGLAPIIPQLLELSPDIDFHGSNSGLTALMYACRGGHRETVKTLLDLGASVNIHSGGTTALLEAVLGGNNETVELTLERKELDINATSSKYLGYTALMLAAQNGAETIVRRLLRRVGIEVNKKNPSGSTALIIAAERGHGSVVILLLDHRGTEIDVLSKLLSRYGDSASMTTADTLRDIVVRLSEKRALGTSMALYKNQKEKTLEKIEE